MQHDTTCSMQHASADIENVSSVLSMLPEKSHTCKQHAVPDAFEGHADMHIAMHIMEMTQKSYRIIQPLPLLSIVVPTWHLQHACKQHSMVSVDRHSAAWSAWKGTAQHGQHGKAL